MAERNLAHSSSPSATPYSTSSRFM
jgi:hypothetical protein